MKRLLVIALLVAGCSGPAAAQPPQAQPGNPAVYQRIAGLSDCAALQVEFDIAAANHDRAVAGSAAADMETAYMVAANDRMHAIGCP